jgi:hypothetical protein
LSSVPRQSRLVEERQRVIAQINQLEDKVLAISWIQRAGFPPKRPSRA